MRQTITRYTPYDVKVYKCDYCGDEYKWKCNLKRHMKAKKHDEHDGLSQDMKDALDTYKLYGETKEDMYKCTFCSYISKGKYNVKRHEKEIHYYDE